MYHSIKRDELFDVILLVISLFSFCLSCFPVYCNVHILVFTEKKISETYAPFGKNSGVNFLILYSHPISPFPK